MRNDDSISQSALDMHRYLADALLRDRKRSLRLLLKPLHNSATKSYSRCRHARGELASLSLCEKNHCRLDKHAGRAQVGHVLLEVERARELKSLSRPSVHRLRGHLSTPVDLQPARVHRLAAGSLAWLRKEALEEGRDVDRSAHERLVRHVLAPLEERGVTQLRLTVRKRGRVVQQGVRTANAIGHDRGHDPWPTRGIELFDPHILLWAGDLGRGGGLVTRRRAQQRIEVRFPLAGPLLAELIDGGREGAARSPGPRWVLGVRGHLDEFRASALGKLIHLKDAEVPRNAVVATVDHNASARPLRSGVVLINHLPEKVSLTRDVGIRDSFLSAQLHQSLTVLLKGPSSGDDDTRLFYDRA
mmetsp:Transcript_49973/g.130158  ORF Transcript_49973/g.130158 Transcript_49973/m.130158 type:complete len:359 (+) Transcript_49973:186-1262(+)